MLRAELSKVRTTKTAVGLVLGAVGTTALATTAMVLSQPAEQVGRALHQQQFYFMASIALTTFAAIVGVRSFTDEFRYGSVVPTLLLQPRRDRVLVAKAVAAALVALGMALVVVVAMIAVAVGLGQAKGVRPAIGGADITAVVGMMLAACLWAAIGVAIGAALRHQVAAIVGVIVWIVVLENVLVGFAGGVAALLPGRAAHGLANAAAARDLLAQPASAVVLLAYTAVLGLVGLLLLRRDVQPSGG